MFKVLSTLQLPRIDAETAFRELLDAFDSLSKYKGDEAHLVALRYAMQSAPLPTEVICGRWSCEWDEGREYSGGKRVEQANAELKSLNYRAAPIAASVIAELHQLVPREHGRSSHISLQPLRSALPDPSRMEPEFAGIQRFFNKAFGSTHYACLYFDSPICNERRAGFFGRETLLEIVPGSAVLVVPDTDTN